MSKFIKLTNFLLNTNDIHKINTAEMVRVFLKLCAFSLDNIKGTSIKISRSLNEIRGFFK